MDVYVKRNSSVIVLKFNLVTMLYYSFLRVSGTKEVFPSKNA